MLTTCRHRNEETGRVSNEAKALRTADNEGLRKITDALNEFRQCLTVSGDNLHQALIDLSARNNTVFG
jgi:hypothetical protein